MLKKLPPIHGSIFFEVGLSAPTTIILLACPPLIRSSATVMADAVEEHAAFICKLGPIAPINCASLLFAKEEIWINNS